MDFTIKDNTQVLVLAPAERCINYRWYEDADKMDSRIQLVTPDFVMSDQCPCIVDKFNGLSEGMILIRHPFIREHFVDVTKLEETMLHLKLETMNSIGLKLGAKEIHIHCEVIDSDKRDTTFNAAANAWGANLEVSREKDQEKYSQKAYRIDTENPETNFTIESFEEAVRLAREYGLYGESSIHQLIYNRDPRKPNPLTGKKTVTCSALSETNEKLDIAMHASYLKHMFFDLNVENSCVVKRLISLETSYTF